MPLLPPRALIGFILMCASATAGNRPLIMGTRGVVVSGHHAASDAGLTILKKGGNAIDAGVATVFAQAVVEFDRFGFGGEVPILIHLAGENRVVAINGQGPAPQAATIEWFQSRGIEFIPGDCFLPATVPAVLESLLLALEEFGTLPLADVLEPAIDLAETGFPAYGEFQRTAQRMAPRFREQWPSSAELFLKDGEPPAVGDIFRNPDLARTYRRLVEAEASAAGQGRAAGLKAARDLFYDGEITREIVAFQREFQCQDETGFVSPGLFTEGDFATYEARVEEPASTTYRGIEVFKPGFWSQGPVLLQTLNILEGFDLQILGHNTPPYIHLLAEAMKLAFADREWYYADPDFVSVPGQGLLSKEYAAQRRELIDQRVISMELRPGDPYPFQPQPSAHAPIPATVPYHPWPAGTTGTRVADRDGNVFSATPSGGWFHTSPVIPGLGFVLNTRGQSFWLDASKANALAPGKRPRTTLTPTLALKDGKPYLAWGTPGGDAQDQVNLQVLLNIVEFEMDIQTAIEEPLFQIFDFPPSFYPRDAQPGAMRVETRMPGNNIFDLREMGYQVDPAGPWAIGDATAVRVDLDRGVLFGAASPRRDKSYALAW